MSDLDEIKYWIEDQMTDGLNKMYETLEEKLFELVVARIEKATGELLTADEAASLLGVTNRTLYNWANSGILPRYRLGGQFYWKYADVIERLEMQDGTGEDKTKD